MRRSEVVTDLEPQLEFLVLLQVQQIAARRVLRLSEDLREEVQREPPFFRAVLQVRTEEAGEVLAFAGRGPVGVFRMVPVLEASVPVGGEPVAQAARELQSELALPRRFALELAELQLRRQVRGEDQLVVEEVLLEDQFELGRELVL
jgi:hypothetical protein